MDITSIFNRLLNHEELKREETKELLISITKGELNDAEITALLTAIQMRGITVDELLGFRDGILETGVAVPLDCDRYIDVVGTGGDRKIPSTSPRHLVSSSRVQVIRLPSMATTQPQVSAVLPMSSKTMGLTSPTISTSSTGPSMSVALSISTHSSSPRP